MKSKLTNNVCTNKLLTRLYVKVFIQSPSNMSPWWLVKGDIQSSFIILTPMQNFICMYTTIFACFLDISSISCIYTRSWLAYLDQLYMDLIEKTNSFSFTVASLSVWQTGVINCLVVHNSATQNSPQFYNVHVHPISLLFAPAAVMNLLQVTYASYRRIR